MHLQYLLEHNLLDLRPSIILDRLYTVGLLNKTRKDAQNAPIPTQEQSASVAKRIEEDTFGGRDEVMLLERWNGKLLAEQFKLPALELEVERAVTQVAASITKGKLAEEQTRKEEAVTEHSEEKKQ
jgi:hypothetical protein